jgi:hypothetical protein
VAQGVLVTKDTLEEATAGSVGPNSERERREVTYHRVLLLESRQLLTVKALQQSGVVAPCGAAVVVPNPDAGECAAMAQDPCMRCGAICEEVSHAFLQRLFEESSPPKSDDHHAVAGSALRHTGCELEQQNESVGVVQRAGSCANPPFGFVWLDYCGTFSSRAGRHRQNDLHRLFSGHMLAVPSVLAVTFSKRGSAPLYEHELVDSVVLLVAELSRQWDYIATCCGVASYTITGPMYTVAFLVTDDRTTGPVQLDSIASTSRELLEPSVIDFFPSWSLECHASPETSAPLWLVQQHVGAVFANHVRDLCHDVTASDSVARVFVVDSKLLPATLALGALAGAKCQVEAIVPDPLDELVAQGILRGGDVPRSRASVRCSSIRDALHEFGSGSDKLKGAWLNYERSRNFSFRDLQSCESWSDLESLFRSDILSHEGACLMVSLNHSSVGGCWEGSWTDWLVSGVSAAAEKSGRRVSVAWTGTCTITFPRLFVLFDVNTGRSHLQDGERAQDGLPGGMTATEGWNLRRPKLADAGASKLQRLSAAVMARLCHFKPRTVALHEHGFLTILPLLLDQVNCDVTCVSDDSIQLDEVRRMDTQHVRDVTTISDFKATTAEALLILTEAGLSQLLRSWWSAIETWVGGVTAAQNLVLVFESCGAAALEDLRKRIVGTAESCQLEAVINTSELRCTSRMWVCVSVIVGPNNADFKRFIETWEAVA